LGELSLLETGIRDEYCEAAAVARHCNVRTFDPADFITQVESWNRSRDSLTLADLGRIATREWETLSAQL
jgi:hypothetical protein